MEDPSTSVQNFTSIVDLDTDTLARCTGNLSLGEVSNLAMSCKHLHQATCSDSVWHSLYRREWPRVKTSQEESSVKEAFMSRHIALRQFKYGDPLVREARIRPKVRARGHTYTPPYDGSPKTIFMDKNSIVYSKKYSIHSFRIDDLVNWDVDFYRGHGHRSPGRITCMRSFPLNRSQSEKDDRVLVTSYGHFVQLRWNKGESRCLQGHTGRVSTISDRAVGGDNGTIFASGGQDDTVCLWSINSTRKRTPHTPKAIFRRHETTVSLISVAGHDSSLLASISIDGKVVVWDPNGLSTSSHYVGATSVPIPCPPVAMKCHESLLYIAAGDSVIAIDLRTMQRVSTLALQDIVCSFEALPSKFLLCTGENSSATLWDTRRIGNKSEPIANLDGNKGPVKLIHMDPYKVVTGGPDDPSVRVWAADTGIQTNSLSCAIVDHGPNHGLRGCSAFAVDGYRIVTACSLSISRSNFVLIFRDFRNATCDVQSSIASQEIGTDYEFWKAESDSEDEFGWGHFGRDFNLGI